VKVSDPQPESVTDDGYIIQPAQIITPANFGCWAHAAPVHGLMVNNLKIETPEQIEGNRTPLTNVVQTYGASDSVIKNVDYSSANVLGVGSTHDFTGEATIASWFGTDLFQGYEPPFDFYRNDPHPFKNVAASEYMCLKTHSLILMDNKNPGARIFEWPERVVKSQGRR